MSYEELDDKDLYDKIDQGQLADNFIHSENGKLLSEAAKRITERAIEKFALGAIMPKSLDGKDMIGFITEVLELRLIIRKYKYGLFEEIKLLAEEGDRAADELQERNENLDSATGIGQRP